MENVIGFFGGDSQTGTTTVAWSFAERLSEKGKKVLFLLGSGGDDRAVVSVGSSRSIDDLKASLRSGLVEREDLFQSLEKRGHLWILPGTRNSLAAEYFLENTFQVLLEETAGDFDYVVLDGGSDMRLGLTISALHVCSHRFFVLTQQAKTLHRHMQCRQHLLEPLGIDGEIVINKYRKDPALFLKKDVCRMIGTEEALVIPYMEEGWQMEVEQKNLLGFPRFSRAIDAITDSFVAREKKEKKWKRHFI